MEDISKLWEIDLQNHPLGACRSSATYFHGDSELIKRYASPSSSTSSKRRLIIQRKYFNAGVLVFGDIQNLPCQTFFHDLVPSLWKKTNYTADQDALNIYFEDQVSYLPLEWNFQDGGTGDRNPFSKTIIIVPSTTIPFASSTMSVGISHGKATVHGFDMKSGFIIWIKPPGMAGDPLFNKNPKRHSVDIDTYFCAMSFGPLCAGPT
ncbi:MAG: glycosyltransferase [Caldilineaceae bacterium]